MASKKADCLEKKKKEIGYTFLDTQWHPSHHRERRWFENPIHKHQRNKKEMEICTWYTTVRSYMQ